MRRKNIVRKLPDTTVPSPCIGVCWLNEETRLCDGCLRSADEIRDWMIMDKAEKLALLQELEQRQLNTNTVSGG